MRTNRTYKIPAFALNFAPTTVARFGRACLVRHFDGPYEVIGGTADDHAAVHEWCSLFAPEIVFTSRPDNRLYQAGRTTMRPRQV
jgi:hypothetical protein